MSLVVFLLVTTVKLLVFALFTLLVLKAFLSWMPIDDDSALNRFINTVTEPIINPFRLLIERSPSLRDLPIDLSSLMALLSVVFVYYLLSAIPVS